MNFERLFLIVFFGNYLINTVVAAVMALVPATAGGGIFTTQRISFIVLSSVVVAALAWWYMNGAPRSLKNGLVLGAIGFVVAIATAFVTGVAGVFAQTGSFSAVMGVLPNFWPFIVNWSTLDLLGYWVIPAALIGLYRQPKALPAAASGAMGT